MSSAKVTTELMIAIIQQLPISEQLAIVSILCTHLNERVLEQNPETQSRLEADWRENLLSHDSETAKTPIDQPIHNEIVSLAEAIAEIEQTQQ